MGMLTDRDIVTRAVSPGASPEETIEGIASGEPGCCYEDDDVQAVKDRMADAQVRRIPVVDPCHALRRRNFFNAGGDFHALRTGALKRLYVPGIQQPAIRRVPASADLSPAYVVIGYNVAPVDPCDREFRRLDVSVVRLREIAVDAQRPRFACLVGHDG
ncbi:hypothetical protein [Paraburkholderia sp. EG304]